MANVLKLDVFKNENLYSRFAELKIATCNAKQGCAAAVRWCLFCCKTSVCDTTPRLMMFRSVLLSPMMIPSIFQKKQHMQDYIYSTVTKTGLFSISTLKGFFITCIKK